MRVLVFGASTAQGFWDTEGGWVSRLRRYYDKRIIDEIPKNRNYLTFFNLGISGERTKGIIERLDAETNARLWPGEEYAFIFSTGINDATIKDGKNSYEISEYENDLELIISKAKRYSDRILFLETSVCDEAKTTPIPWGTLHYTNARFKEFNDMLNKVATQRRLPVVKTFGEFQKRMSDGQDLLKDGLHPNDAGHQLIFELVRPALDELIGNNS